LRTLDNTLQVVEEEAFEASPLVAVKVAAGQDRSDIGIKVRDRGRKLMELAENGGDRAGQGLRFPLGVEPCQTLGNKRKEFARDFAGSSGHSEEGRHLAVKSGTECRNGVPSRLALVLSDGRDPHLARAEEKVPIVGQIPAASYDGVHRQVDPLSDHVLSGPLGKQGVSESIHDGEVVSGLGGSDISVKLQAVRIHHVRTLRRACDANREVSSIRKEGATPLLAAR
jgi:hypothetical protein